MTVPTTRTRPGARGAIALALAALLATAGMVTASAPATAADAADFDPGFLISDELFFDGTAMTSSEIDAYIDVRNPGCVAGRVCLENYRETIKAKSANTRCSAIAAGSNRTAGQIIAAVSRACGISPKAIMVILQKEQSLVTAPAPGARAFQAAMGAGCPDTAPCDGNYAGFYEQVYYGAYLLKGYTIPGSTHYNRYAAGKYSEILYQANRPSCGTKRVFVRNQATHALYVYTPYTPNQAALDNLYGYGDECSAYGNRNFWRIYTDWFGTTGGDGYSAIFDHWERHGGESGWLGAPTTEVVRYEDNGGGLVRGHEGGAIIWTETNGVATISGELRAYYAAHGGVKGDLAWPTADPKDYTVNGGGTIQWFQKAAVLQSDAGLFTITGALRSAYGKYSTVHGPLGWPASEAYTDPSTGFAAQDFQGGTLLVDGSRYGWTRTNLVAPVVELGGFTGSLGWPTGGVNVVDDNGGGVVQAYEGGAITRATGGDVHLVTGTLRTMFGRTGGLSGPLGWPTSDAYTDPSTGFAAQDFQGGTLLVDGSRYGWTRTNLVAPVVELGGFTDSLGWPTGGVNVVEDNGGGVVQAYEGGAITRATGGDVHLVTGTLRTMFGRTGGLSGPLGWPTSDAYTHPSTGFAAQDFQGGTLLVDGKGYGWTRTNLVAPVVELGGFTGSLGWPTGGVNVVEDNGGGVVQAYEGGAITRATGGDVHLVTGTLRTMFGRTGGLSGPLGWPTSDAYTHPSTGFAAQDFQGGTLLVDGKGYGWTRTNLVAPVVELGGFTGSLGWPTGGVNVVEDNGGGVVQAYEGGAITRATGGDVHLVTGTLRTMFGRTGGLSGPLGWPTSDAYTHPSTGFAAQDFQDGTLLVDGNGYLIRPVQ